MLKPAKKFSVKNQIFGLLWSKKSSWDVHCKEKIPSRKPDKLIFMSRKIRFVEFYSHYAVIMKKNPHAGIFLFKVGFGLLV